MVPRCENIQDETFPQMRGERYSFAHAFTGNAKFNPSHLAVPKVRDRPVYSWSPNLGTLGACRAREKRLPLYDWEWYMPCQCIMHWPPGFARCLKDADRARCRAHQISPGAGLGSRLSFDKFVASLALTFCTPVQRHHTLCRNAPPVGALRVALAHLPPTHIWACCATPPAGSLGCRSPRPPAPSADYQFAGAV